MVYNYADNLVFTLAAPRYQVYMQSDVQLIQNEILAQVTPVSAMLGFLAVSAEMTLLDSTQASGIETLALGLILNVMSLMVIGISTILIYSLLMISIEKRRF